MKCQHSSNLKVELNVEAIIRSMKASTSILIESSSRKKLKLTLKFTIKYRENRQPSAVCSKKNILSKKSERRTQLRQQLLHLHSPARLIWAVLTITYKCVMVQNILIFGTTVCSILSQCFLFLTITIGKHQTNWPPGLHISIDINVMDFAILDPI